MQAKDEIANRKFVPLLPKGFTYDALDGISGHGLRGEPLGNDQAKPGAGNIRVDGKIAWRRYNEQRPSGKTFAL